MHKSLRVVKGYLPRFMKALITVTRETVYTSIVEITPEEFAKLDAALYDGTREERKKAEEKVNNMIDVNDWQCDDLKSVDDFEEFKEEPTRARK